MDAIRCPRVFQTVQSAEAGPRLQKRSGLEAAVSFRRLETVLADFFSNYVSHLWRRAVLQFTEGNPPSPTGKLSRSVPLKDTRVPLRRKLRVSNPWQSDLSKCAEPSLQTRRRRITCQDTYGVRRSLKVRHGVVERWRKPIGNRRTVSQQAAAVKARPPGTVRHRSPL